MRDLHEVVDLRAGLDARLPHRRPVDRGVGADLDVVFDDDAADLRDLLVRAVGVAREAEAVAADHRAVLHDHAVAELHALADRHARMQDAVVADAGVRTDDDVGVDDRAGADPGARLDDGERADATRRAATTAVSETKARG